MSPLTYLLPIWHDCLSFALAGLKKMKTNLNLTKWLRTILAYQATSTEFVTVVEQFVIQANGLINQNPRIYAVALKKNITPLQPLPERERTVTGRLSVETQVSLSVWEN